MQELYKCKDNSRYSVYLCHCGSEKRIRRDSLGKSCGCLSGRTHGLSKTCEYRIWQQMKLRCLQPKRHNYKDYGGRGITICKQWIHSFETFYKNMGIRPTSKHSIDRIDNDGNYTPENCKWSTPQEQARNRRLPKRKNTKYHGIQRSRSGDWQVVIATPDGRVTTGTFKNDKCAAIAYNNKVIELGLDNKLNQI